MSQPLSQWKEEIHSCLSLKEWEELRVKLLGKSGAITLMLKELGKLDAEQRRIRGAEINHLKDTVISELEKRKTSLAAAELDKKLRSETVDVTLSCRPEKTGSIHPVTHAIEEIVAYFSRLGFDVVEGPDIEDEEHNFNALNIPEHHPARQSHDTFYFPPDEHGQTKLLRTHTSPVQIRTMKKQQPPLRILAPGRVYRYDYDATHTPTFHQFEGLVVDKNIHMGHLKGCIEDFCRHFFGIKDLPVRFRPSFFPFTEPSAEIDVGYTREGNSLKIGPGGSWLELGGCGMVHPKVLKNCGIDPDVYQGFAFGMGADRFAMLKYGIPDLRSFFEPDMRWLKHYGFSPFASI